MEQFKQYMNPPAKKGCAYQPTIQEQRANICTHVVFILPSFAATVLLAYLSHTTRQNWVAWVYGLSMTLMFTLSTLHHLMCHYNRTGRLRFFCHLGDRAVIYVFIAASYSPWMLLRKHTIGEEVLWATWIAALLGILYQYSFYERYKWLETLFYLMIGLFPSFVIFEMEERDGIIEVALGGAIYIIGIGLFKCDGRVPFAHAIWHCFVTVAAAFHYYAVLVYLYPSGLFQQNLTAERADDS